MSQFLGAYYADLVERNRTVQQALCRLDGSRCLVTGASGIIGYALARLLDAYTTAEVSLAMRNPAGEQMAWLKRSRPVSYETLTSHRYDYIFHCATHSPPSKFLADWQATIRLNTCLVLDLLAVTDQKFILASTAEIYSGEFLNVTEEGGGKTTPQHTRGIYIESKRVAEAACTRSGLGCASRIAYTAGPYPRKDDTRAIFELIRKARARGAVALLGGHQSLRQYQYTGSCALRMLVAGVLGRESVYNNAGSLIAPLETFARVIADKLGVPYIDEAQSTGIAGAPGDVQLSMQRFHDEFPEMVALDPTLEEFIEWLVADCD